MVQRAIRDWGEYAASAGVPLVAAPEAAAAEQLRELARQARVEAWRQRQDGAEQGAVAAESRASDYVRRASIVESNVRAMSEAAAAREQLAASEAAAAVMRDVADVAPPAEYAAQPAVEDRAVSRAAGEAMVQDAEERAAQFEPGASAVEQERKMTGQVDPGRADEWTEQDETLWIDDPADDVDEELGAAPIGPVEDDAAAAVEAGPLDDWSWSDASAQPSEDYE